MNTLNHLTLEEGETIYGMFEECDLNLADYKQWLDKRIAHMGNAIEYVCYMAVGQAHYKQLLAHFKIIGAQVISISPAESVYAILNKSTEPEPNYPWEFLFNHFGRRKAA